MSTAAQAAPDPAAEARAPAADAGGGRVHQLFPGLYGGAADPGAVRRLRYADLKRRIRGPRVSHPYVVATLIVSDASRIFASLALLAVLTALTATAHSIEQLALWRAPIGLGASGVVLPALFKRRLAPRAIKTWDIVASQTGEPWLVEYFGWPTPADGSSSPTVGPSSRPVIALDLICDAAAQSSHKSSKTSCMQGLWRSLELGRSSAPMSRLRSAFSADRSTRWASIRPI